MPERTQAAVTGLVLLLILVFHLTVAWQDMATLSCNGFLYDDSFYAFKIAQNIAAGKGMTFDGVHPTTGFQPLYVFLLVPAYMIADGDLHMPIYIALTMLAMLTCLTAYLVFRISRRYTGFVPAIIAAAVWGLSPIVAKQGTNGLETALSTFMIALSVYYYIDRIRPHWILPNRRMAVLGMLLGITVLSRIDGVFLVLVMMLDYLLVLRKRKKVGLAMLRISLVAAGVAIFYGPWLLVNILESGSPIQDSGTATRFLSMAYATYFENGGSELASRGPDGAFILEHLKHSLSTIKVAPISHVLFRSLDKIGEMWGARGVMHIAGNIAGVMVLIAIAMSVRHWKRDPELSRRRELDFLLLLSGVLMLSYSVYIFGAFFFMRYFYPIYLTSCIFLAFYIQDAINWCKRCPVYLGRMALAGAVLYASLFLVFTWSQTYRTRPIYPFYEIAKWVEENTGQDDRIGVFQCGMIGYFSNRDIINLDGKVNRDALVALKSGQLDSYMDEEGIDLIIDHSKILRIFLDSPPGRLKECCIPILPQEKNGWVALERARINAKADVEETDAGVTPLSANRFYRLSPRT